MEVRRTACEPNETIIGGLLRTAPLKEARARRERGEITAAQLREVEDREIEGVIRKQEEAGLQAATDGESRRSWWHFDFLKGLDGVEGYATGQGIQFPGRTDEGRGCAGRRQGRLLGTPGRRTTSSGGSTRPPVREP